MKVIKLFQTLMLISIFLTSCVSYVLADGADYARKGLSCMEKNNYACVISNFEKALASGDLTKEQQKAVKESLRTHYHAYIDKKSSNWSAKKIEDYCKKGIKLSKELSLSGDWYDISFYLWAAIVCGDDNQIKKAKKWVSKAENLLAQGKYKKDIGSTEHRAFKDWADKIIQTVRKL